MGWVRIDDNAPHHKKMLKAGPAACWLWVCGLAYCQRMKSDGSIPSEAMLTLGVRQWKTCAAALETAGLWHVVDGGYQVHDYLAWNATKEERQAQTQAHRDRTAKWRAGKCDASQPINGDESVTRHSESGVTLLHSSPLPSTKEQRTPLPPSAEGGTRRITRKALKHAEDTRRGLGGCPHSPPCEQYQACLRLMAGGLSRAEAEQKVWK